MNNVLNQILFKKQMEVVELKRKVQDNPNISLAKRFHRTLKRPGSSLFKSSLSKAGLSVIAEIKRKSPSKGWLADIEDPALLAQSYALGGASALSVLTDYPFFGGTLDDLIQVKSKAHLPVLRKDFIIHEIQIAESVEAGADAVLLIVSILGEALSKFLICADELGIEALVEVHNPEELKIALSAGAQIIGVNHRNLSTFQMQMDLGLQMIQEMGARVIKVAESGIEAPQTARYFHAAGFDAVLIGEALVKSASPEHFISQCCEVG